MSRSNHRFKASYGGNSFQNAKVIKYYFYSFFSKVFYFILIILSLIIIKIDISNKNINNFVRDKILFISSPLFVIADLPFNLLFDFASSVKGLLLTNVENKYLVKENIKLKTLYLESIDINFENRNLKKLLNFKDSVKDQYNYITSKVYLNTKNGIDSMLTLNIGSKEGIKEGSLVIGINQSVVGRTINVRENYSDVLLLNDINSRIPARTASTKEKIIISGSNKNLLEISYYNSKNPNIEEGDLVYTSGDSNMIPDGFFIGEIKKNGPTYFLQMNESVNNVFNVVVIVPKI